MARREEIEVWVADLDACGEAPGSGSPSAEGSARSPDSCERGVPFTSLLSPRELARAQRIRGEIARARWVASRGILRVLAGELLQLDPRTVRFDISELGKPRFATLNRHRVPVCFNLSHSGGLAVYAFAAGREVGVDVELRERRAGDRDDVALARRFLGHEQASRLALAPAAERHPALLRAWTQHEARVKCLGLGIGLAADGAHAEALDSLWVRELDVGPAAVASVAAQGDPGEVRVRRFER
ncbi:MAG: 4'-phosphopantetheinyl transferase family protein [Solirubrobacteraceae bacterium]